MLILNEWRFCLRQPLVLASLILMPILTFMLSGGVQEESFSLTSQLQLTQTTLLMLLLPILLGAITPPVFLRDTTANMIELINSTPITHHKRWLLRYGSVVSLFLVLYILSYATVLLSYTLQFGFQVEFITLTIINVVLLVLPTILFATAFALWLSIYWQSAMVMYVSIAAVGMSLLMLASMTGSPVLAGSSVVSESFYNAMLWLDPYGITALVDNLSSDSIYPSVELLINRLIYLLLSGAFVYVVLNKKETTKVTKKRHNKADISTASQPTKVVKQPARILPESPFIQLIKVPLLTLLHSRITQIILLIWPMIIFNEVMSGITYVETLSTISPNSIDALNLVAFDLFKVLGAFVIALWSWFICSRDKSFNFAELIAAAPISNLQLIGGQIIALAAMVAILLLLTLVGSSLAELAAGSDFLFQHYLIQLSLSGLPLLMLGTLFICLHHLCRSTITSGVIVFLIILIKFTPIMTSLGLTHTLWNIADSPLQAPDNFWGYSASLSVYWPYMAVWLAVCVAAVSLAISRSHRGTGLGKLSLKGLPKSVLLSFLVASVMGFSLHFELVNEKPLTNSHKRESWKAQYEKNFAQWQQKAQPSIVHIDSKIDIYPEQQFANFKLSYTLENRTATPIMQVLIGRYGNYSFGDITLDGAKLVEFDAKLNQGIYQLSQQLMPGEQRVMHAEFRFNQSQYWPHRSHQVVKADFSYFRADPLLPTIGYQAEYQLEDPQIRAEYKLNNFKSAVPSELFKGETVSTNTYQWATQSTIISTLKGHYGVSQGELVSSWQQEQRSFFQFETKQPIRSIPTWMSLPYSALSQNVQGVELNVYSPSKNEAAKVNLKAMADTLSWFTKHITPYAGAQLNLVAVPDIGSAGYSLPQMTLIKNTVGFRSSPSSKADFDQRYRRAVHETAHQWFGHSLGNGVKEDRSFLTESMANYIELVIIEKHHGKNAMLALVELAQKRFDLSQRNNFQTSKALVDATQEHDVLSRATLVFAELRETVGDKDIIAALKSLWAQHAYPKTPATSMDFVRALQRNTAQKHHALINTLLLTH